MGLDYEYHLRFKREKLQEVLLAIAMMTETAEPIVFPEAKPYRSISLGLLFIPDEPLRAYWKERQGEGQSEELPEKIAIGSIDLVVRSTVDEVTFEFQPATTAMSILFAKSESIRQAFVQLLEEHGGIQGEFADSDYKWGPVVIWPETSPDYDPTNLFILHNTLSPDIPYYRRYR